MKKMKTFLTYLLLVVAFGIVSTVLQNGLIKQMYRDIYGTVNYILDYSGELLKLETEVTEAKTTNANGYINLKIKNTSDRYINEAYIKVELYTKSDVCAITKYMEINGLSQNEERTYTLKFKGSYIKSYKITLEKEYPDKDYIVNIFGYDVNVKDIFGMDLSEYISADSLRNFGSNMWGSFTVTVRNIPWWAWLWAWTIVVGVW